MFSLTVRTLGAVTLCFFISEGVAAGRINMSEFLPWATSSARGAGSFSLGWCRKCMQLGSDQLSLKARLIQHFLVEGSWFSSLEVPSVFALSSLFAIGETEIRAGVCQEGKIPITGQAITCARS